MVLIQVTTLLKYQKSYFSYLWPTLYKFIPEAAMNLMVLAPKYHFAEELCNFAFEWEHWPAWFLIHRENLHYSLSLKENMRFTWKECTLVHVGQMRCCFICWERPHGIGPCCSTPCFSDGVGVASYKGASYAQLTTTSLRIYKPWEVRQVLFIPLGLNFLHHRWEQNYLP